MLNKKPHIIFLHGLLGTKFDWQAIIQRLPAFHCVALDLPFHGEAKHIAVQNFDDCCDYLEQQISQEIGADPFVLVGYSLGGRIALYYTLNYALNYTPTSLQGLILEGANFGLTQQTEKQARWLNDEKWATRFCTEPPEIVLNDWYRQAVFSHLTEQQRTQLIQKRAPNCGENIGKMLRATSLAKQPDLNTLLQKARSNSTALFPIHYFVGEQDQKFRQLAQQYGLSSHIIPNAGHNAHTENPQNFAEQLERIFWGIEIKKRGEI